MKTGIQANNTSVPIATEKNQNNSNLGLRSKSKMSELKDQYRYPTGHYGRLVAASMNREHEPLTRWGLSYIKIESHYLILDVGCGGGKTLSRLAELASKGKIFGIDHSADMVAYARNVNKALIAQNRVEIVKSSVEKTSFPDAFFDLVTAFETYYFWSNFAGALVEINRVLKPNGLLLLVNEMVQNGDYEIKNAKLIQETHVQLIPLGEIQSALRSVGFEGIKVFTKAKSPWNAILAQKPSAAVSRCQ